MRSFAREDVIGSYQKESLLEGGFIKPKKGEALTVLLKTFVAIAGMNWRDFTGVFHGG
jgi:hypothetical protein